MNRRITQKDVARALGMHVSTVSKALSGDPAIAAGTKEKVREKAVSMGFVPDPMMGALAAYRKRLQPEVYRATIAWVQNQRRSESMDHFSGYSDYREGATTRAAELGYQLDSFWVGDLEGGATSLEDILNARGIRGVIIAPQANPERVLKMDWSRYSSVAIGYTANAGAVDRVTNDHFATMTDLLEQLQRRGYERIGCHLWKVDNERMGQRARSAFLAVSQRDLIKMKSYSRFDGAAFLKWVRQYELDALICRGSQELELLRDTGIKVPNDIGVVSYAVAEDESLLSGMYHNNRRIGATAVDWLSAKLQRGEFGHAECSQRLLVTGQWIENKTLLSLDGTQLPKSTSNR